MTKPKTKSEKPKKLLVQDAVCMGARWSEHAAALWGDWEVIFETSQLDYQGSAEFLATKGEKFVFVEWSYGSCGGCDGWEDQPESKVREDMQRQGMEFKDAATLEAWLLMVSSSKSALLGAYTQWAVERGAKISVQAVDIGVLYKNTKTNGVYVLCDLGTHTETNEPMAHYRAATWQSREKKYARIPQGPSHFSPLTRFAGRRKDGRWYFEEVMG